MSTTEATKPPELWGQGMRIPILMLSGKVNSGKTLFGLTIDPNCRRPAAEVNPTTLVYDQEGSSEPYVGGLNFDWKDTRAAVAEGVHMEVLAPNDSDPRWLKILKQQADCNDSPAASMFRAWYLSLIKVPAKRYSVGVVDTFTPIQDGMVDWLRRHPEAFGRTVSEYTKASSMFLWPDVKSMLSHILTVDCRLRFQTFVLTLHMKHEWASGQRTGRMIAEGLDVLEKLATIHFELDRTPKAKGKDAPRVPAGITRKERLVRFGATGADDRPVLPPRMPECTPDAIREYIANPPDFANLKAQERASDDSLSDDQKLMIQREITQNEADAATAKLSAMEMARQAAATMAAEQTKYAAEMLPPAPPAQAQPQQQSAQSGPITKQQFDEMLRLMKSLFASGAAAGEWLMEHAATADPSTLTESKATDVLVLLNQMASAAATPPQPGPSPDARLDATQQHATQQPAQPESNSRATQEQRDKIRDLTIRTHGDKAPDEQAAWLRSLGYGSANSLTFAQAESRITQLREAFADGPPF